MSDTKAPPSGVVRRRRGAALQEAIFAATLSELGAVGYTGLTMDSVALTAGTGKAALYRRWTSKAELVTDALRSVLPDPARLRPTGDFRTDALALLRCMRDAAVLTHGTAFQVAKQESGLESGVHSMVQERVLRPCQDLLLKILQDGVRDGRLRAGADSPRVAVVGPAMLIHRALTVGPDEVTDDYLTAIIDEVIMPLTAP